MQKRPVQVKYYDGCAAEVRDAFIQPLSADLIQLSYGEETQQQIEIAYRHMGFIGAVGNRPAIIELPNDGRIEFIQRVPHWFAKRQKWIYQQIWLLERNPMALIGMTIAACVVIFGVMKWVIPFLALQLAQFIPDTMLKTLGDETERQIVAKSKASTLTLAHQKRLEQRFLAEIVDRNQPVAKLIFRQGEGSIGANALAIPNHTIVLTDELVALAGNDEEVLAVLAHEQGHLLRKHAMQKLISIYGSSLIWDLMNQDGNPLLTAAAVTLTQAEYSQQLERDADYYAMQHLHQRGISSMHLANFLQRVENRRLAAPQKKRYTLQLDDLFKSHPDEAERIQAIHAFVESRR